MSTTSARREFASIPALGLVATAAASLASPAAAQLFGPGDHILAIDTDDGVVNSSYPGAEAPGDATDQVNTTKYLNFGGDNTGFIVTPSFGASLIQGLRFTTANDASDRDPTSYALYGTNDPISSADNSAGDAENWTLITSNTVNLPFTRQAFGPIHDFANGTAYSSYKIIFPTLRGGPLMQVADVSLFTGAGGGGSQVLADGDFALAVADLEPDSNYPGAEGPGNALDGDPATKYLNFGRENSGFIVHRADGLPTIVDEFTITTANDSPSRDPTAWLLFGTNDPVTSADNSMGGEESWTLIDSGSLDLPLDRLTAGMAISVNNATAYGAYRMVFPTIRDPFALDADSLQFADIVFGGTVIPAPPAAAGMAFGALLLLRRGRRQDG